MQRSSQVETHHTEAHHRLVALFVEVVQAGQRGAWSEARDLHEAFTVAFAAHLRHEEQVEFPAYEASSLAHAADVELLRLQHSRLRQLAGRISVALREDPDTKALDELVDFQFAWALHDQREAQTFHRWLERRTPQRIAPFVEGAYVRV